MATNSQDDAELWQQVRQDDRAAYEVLYWRYINVVFAEVHKRVLQKGEAEDITQDVFLTLWEKRMDIVLENRFYSYLYRTVQNRVLNFFRDKKIPAAYLEAWETLPEDTAVLMELPVAFKEAGLLNMEYLLEAERQNLPIRIRQVYELRYGQRMTTREISEQLVISPNTVRNHLKEARKRFSSALRKASLLFNFLIIVLIFRTIFL